VDIVEPPASAAAPAPAPPVTAKRVIFASVAVYALSLGLPAIREVASGRPGDRGYLVLTMGMLGVLFGQFGWFANGLYALGLIQLSRHRWKAAAIAAGLAVLLAADSFMLLRSGFPSDSGTHHPVAFQSGFYVWWGSLWILAAGALLLWRGQRIAASEEVRSGS